MIKLYLIRHGQTPGNKLARYIGTTDEPLSDEGREFLKKISYPMPEELFVSPLLRCVETAEILLRIKITKSLPEMKIIRNGSTAMEQCRFRAERAEKALNIAALQDFRKL